MQLAVPGYARREGVHETVTISTNAKPSEQPLELPWYSALQAQPETELTSSLAGIAGADVKTPAALISERRRTFSYLLNRTVHYVHWHGRTKTGDGEMMKSHPLPNLTP